MTDRGDADGIGPLAGTLRQYRRGRRLTQKQLASSSDISLRTIQDLETGKTRSPQFHTLERLANVLAQGELERDVLFSAAYPQPEPQEPGAATVKQSDRNAAPASVEKGDSPPEPVSAEVQSSSRFRWRFLILSGFAALALILTLLAGSLAKNGTSPPTVALSSSCSIPPAPPIPKTPYRIGNSWRATVVNTWSLSRCEDIGVRPRVSPLGSKKLYPGFFTGTWVFVTCYYRQGVPITDKDTQESSTTWYRLDDKGSWLSAMFLQIGDQPGSSPPPGMPVCRGVK